MYCPSCGFCRYSRRRLFRFAAVVHTGYDTPAITHGPVPRYSPGL